MLKGPENCCLEKHNNFIPSWLFWLQLPRYCQIPRLVVLRRDAALGLGFSIIGGNDFRPNSAVSRLFICGGRSACCCSCCWCRSCRGRTCTERDYTVVCENLTSELCTRVTFDIWAMGNIRSQTMQSADSRMTLKVALTIRTATPDTVERSVPAIASGVTVNVHFVLICRL